MPSLCPAALVVGQPRTHPRCCEHHGLSWNLPAHELWVPSCLKLLERGRAAVCVGPWPWVGWIVGTAPFKAQAAGLWEVTPVSPNRESWGGVVPCPLTGPLRGRGRGEDLSLLAEGRLACGRGQKSAPPCPLGSSQPHLTCSLLCSTQRGVAIKLR